MRAGRDASFDVDGLGAGDAAFTAFAAVGTGADATVVVGAGTVVVVVAVVGGVVVVVVVVVGGVVVVVVVVGGGASLRMKTTVTQIVPSLSTTPTPA